MPELDPLLLAGVALAFLALTLAALRLRQRRRASAKPGSATAARPEGRDLVSRYQPSAVRVLSQSERQAFALAREALPGHIVMAQVPLVRYLRVQDKRVEDDWLRGLSMLSADILVCDPSTRPVLAIEVLPPKLGGRAKERHDRMRQLLEGVGVRVLIWQEGRLPALDQVQAQMRAAAAASGEATPAARQQARALDESTAPAAYSGTSRRQRSAPAQGASAERITPPLMPSTPEQPTEARSSARQAGARPHVIASLIPAPEISELLAEGDEIAARHPSMDPVSLTFFDEFETRSQSAASRPH